MSAVSETAFRKLTRADSDSGANFVEFTKKRMIRTYPAATRFASGNYSPMEVLSAGAQMVALNFQSRDTPLEVYLGLFRDNGGCGYVLKPEFLRNRTSFSFFFNFYY